MTFIYLTWLIVCLEMLILSLFDGKKHLLIEISFFGITNAVLPYDDKNNEKIIMNNKQSGKTIFFSSLLLTAHGFVIQVCSLPCVAFVAQSMLQSCQLECLQKKLLTCMKISVKQQLNCISLSCIWVSIIFLLTD